MARIKYSYGLLDTHAKCTNKGLLGNGVSRGLRFGAGRRVEPNLVTFNPLISRLMFEGDAAGARRVVEEEMPAAGVQPNDRTFKTLNRPKHKLGKMRTGELQRLLKLGNVGAACALMDKLVIFGAANRKHRAIMGNHYNPL